MDSHLQMVIHDPARLAALQQCALLDTPAEEVFDQLTRLASQILRAPIVLISLVDAERQFFKSAVGLAEPWASRRETPLSHSFCQQAIASGQALVIADARHHLLVSANPAIADFGWVAYLGVPLVTPEGAALGTLCVMDHQPRDWTETDLNILRVLAGAVMNEFQLRAYKREVARLTEEHATWKTLVEHSADVIGTASVTGEVISLNPAGRHRVGLERVTEARALMLTDLLADEDAPIFRALVLPAARRHGQWEGELRFKSRRTGELILLHSRVWVVRASTSGVPSRLALVAHDVTERQQTESALRETRTRLTHGLSELAEQSRAMAQLHEASLTLQACHTFAEAWAASARLFGQLFPAEAGALYWLDDSRHLAERMAQWGQTPPAAAAFVPEACAALRQGHTQLLSDAAARACHHLDHPPSPASLCLPMLAQGETFGLIHLRGSTPEAFTDAKVQLARTAADSVTLALANLRLRETLRQQSIRDALTGVFNRRYMEESLEREISRAARAGQTLGIIMLDLDHFKRVNDTFGHEAGDEVLRRLGQLLESHVRTSDIVCRYGGEEFILILPEAPLAVTCQRAEQVCQRIKLLTIQHQGQALGPITLSAGLAMFPQHGASGAAVMQAADAALYRAKHAGRDRVVVAD